MAGDQPLFYINHPWLASLLLAAWTGLWGDTEVAFRSLALVLSLARIGLIGLTGRLLAGPRVGLLAAFFYAVAPLSVHLGRVYGMETLCLTFMLGAFHVGCRWWVQPERRCWWAGALLLALAQASDVYPLLLAPWLAWLALRTPARRRGLLLWLMVPILVQVALMTYLLWLGLLHQSLVRGVGKHRSAAHAFTWEYYRGQLTWLLRGNAYLPPVLALAGLARLAWIRRGWEVVGLWAAVLLPQLVLTSYWMVGHDYLTLMWSPPVAWLAAYSLQGAPLGAGLLAAGLAAWLARGPTAAFLTERFRGDVDAARAISQALGQDDLVVGTPPHMGYYLRHLACVPYDYFWGAGLDAEARRRRLRELVEGTGTRYRRVILLTLFLSAGFESNQVDDYSHALDSLEGWQRVSPAPGPNLEVWKRK